MKSRGGKAELLAELEAGREDHVRFLQAFLRAPSPNPPGDTRAAADVIGGYLAGHGIDAATVAPKPEMPNIVADCPGGRGDGKRLILNGHIDVFPVGDAAEWTRGPWSGDLDGGVVHGRGATDMKSGTAASVIAFRALHARQAAWSGSLGLTAVSDEETGGRWGALYLLNSDPRWRGDCMLNAEPGGLGTIRFAEKGTLRLTFTVRTAGAHGAYLHRTESATRLAAALIGRLASLEDIDPGLPADLVAYLTQEDVRAAIDGAMGPGAADIVARPTLNIGTVHGGLKVNMIPAGCVFEADIRLPVGLDASHVMDRVAAILADFPQAEVAVQEAASNPATSCRHDHPLVGIIARNAEVITGTRPLAVPSLGATDCKHWRRAGVPAYIYGPAPGRMAMTDESVPVEEFLAVVKTHASSAWDYLDGQG